MFIEESNPIEVIVHYRKIGRGFIAYTDSAFKEAKIDEASRSQYKSVKVSMKPLTWESYNDLQDRSFVPDETGKRKFNYRLYKENKLKSLIAAWDAKTTNEKGETVTVPINDTNVMKLSPDIAEAILEGYDSAALMSEEEEKKS